MTDFVTTKGIDSWKQKTGKINEQRVTQALESANVAYCKVTTLQELYPDVKEYLNPLYPHKVACDENDTEEKCDKASFRNTYPVESFIPRETFVVQEKYFRSVVEL